jgi:hypothetical protein
MSINAMQIIKNMKYRLQNSVNCKIFPAGYETSSLITVSQNTYPEPQLPQCYNISLKAF